ncbi:hypothetical protein Asp14428_46830 [Actinoplanes sp. NBRC 14428]|nr:hypothetical protein [Pseudosporangium ferrugineum]BCJ53208.1 hypothetical protein Asp14428_46830 [Actinoplanes sp. NBRC 14428]
MPPHSQEAERRRGNRSGSRWGLRVLVVGGLAGAAWLLSGAAAHAADHEPTLGGLLPGAVTHAVQPSGSSLLGTVQHGGEHAVQNGGERPLVDRVLRTVVKPSESDRHRTVLGAVTAVPQRLVDTVGEVTHGTKDAGVTHVVRDLTAPTRLIGDAVDARPLAPAPGLSQDAAEPEPAPASGLPHDAAGPEPAPQQDRPEPDAGATTPGVPPTEGPAAEVATGGHKSAPVLHKAPVRHPVGKTAVWHPAAPAVAVPETVREKPDGDGPAPLRVNLGAANGFPVSGAGTATDGGPSAAVLPSAVADSTMACHRLPLATDVEVRRHDAEAPTVSPD